MRVEIVRIYNCPAYCIGRLYVDGACVCDTLEDTDRGLDEGMDEREMLKPYRKNMMYIHANRGVENEA